MGPYPASADPNRRNVVITSSSSSLSSASSHLNKTNAATAEDGPSSRSGKSSFFSRLNLPLRSRGARHVADFHVRPAEPHRKYAAGDHVRGAVVLTVIKSVRITHLTVALHGYVRVYRTPAAAAAANDDIIHPAEPPSNAGNSRLRYFGNGHASLFQDEQVLSADGKLEPGKYEFGFDLLFPSRGLPSSIDFERGTISYMVTAMLTRPTAIAPTMCCEQKIYLVEQVDVGYVMPPRPRTIYLEPISKRVKRKKSHKSERAGSGAADAPEQAFDLDSTRAHETSTEGSNSEHREDMGHDVLPMVQNSPVQSDFRSISGDSALSGSTGMGRIGELSAGGQPSGSQASRQTSTIESRTITATIELVKGGCIPGDTLPVKLWVQHIKSIKSMHGVIVTLYRQGRVDTAPPISSFQGLSAEEIKRIKKDELYPKSRTGLGGLSLTSIGSCSIYRKDLSQAFSPLLIDPGSMKANVTASVRVPEDVFPTVKDVPGDLITFKYYVEVLVDLGGKLARQLQSRGSSSGARGGLTASPGFGATQGSDPRPSIGPLFGNGMVNTDALRREKGVVSVVFEIVVGTIDTQRQRGRAASKVASVHTQPLPEADFQHMNGDGKSGWHGAWQNGGEDEHHGNGGFFPEGHDHFYPPFRREAPTQDPYWNSMPPAPPPPPLPAVPQYIPLPNPADESQLPEKERIRRAEQRLLPSQPPVAPPYADRFGNTRASDHDNTYDAEDGGPSAPSLSAPPSLAAGPAALDAGPSAPTLEELGASLDAGPADDKQELERRRLLGEASAPPEVPDDDETGGGRGRETAGFRQVAEAVGPSAPVLTEEDEYGASHAHATGAGPLNWLSMPGAWSEEPLPWYER